ncbi:sugar phosphate isomerase/epimerase [uncultured Algibacter sp.]|uniref:sugar phosphate isomerase/epimerase n=1 Tax=uncultured Algibacter sp. TaxID=298659 RepID=UPI00261FA95B|nr:sugar phosphate isomerase/epimerase [uncultured Algibacter sp.]
MQPLNRIDFVKLISIAGRFVPLLGFSNSLHGFHNYDVNKELSVHIFSKYLQFLDYRIKGEVAVQMGFSGVDLAVRPKGYVLPEQIKIDLPKAVSDINTAGSHCEMITTSIENINNSLDVDIIETATKQKINYYHANWFNYIAGKLFQEPIAIYKEQIKELSIFNSNYNIIGCYKKHEGKKEGVSFWEIKRILEYSDLNYFGTQNDIRHAKTEGDHSWISGFKLLYEHIKVIVLKGFNGVYLMVNGKLLTYQLIRVC